MILWEILIINSVLQAATILVAMASEKNFGDQNSGEIRQLATNRLKEKLNNMSWSVPPSRFFLFCTTEFFYGHHKLQLKIAKRWLFEKVSLERCNFFQLTLSCHVIVISVLNLSDITMNKRALKFMVFIYLQQEDASSCLIVYGIRK